MRKKRARLKNFCINTDHLGNTRVSFQDTDGNGSIDTENEVVEVNDYYPFGLQHQKANQVVGGSLGQKFKFLGQEHVDDLGLNWISFRHRHGDPALGRFFGVDPVSEEYYSISTYQFAHNNPVWKIELEGLEGIPVNGSDVINHEPVVGNTNIGNSALPIGDSSSTSYGSSQNVTFIGQSRSNHVTGYPGQALEEAVTSGIQWLASELTNSDVSEETAGNIELATNVVILLSSKGKNKKAASEIVEQASKKLSTKATNIAKAESKGIPKSQLGPSGKPKIHVSKHATNKRAKDAARNNPRSNSKPVKHSSDNGQKTHYHATRDGKKLTGKDNTHYTNEATKRNNE